MSASTDSSMRGVILAVGVCFVSLAAGLKWLRKTRRLYPPGPPAKNWLLGNLREVPPQASWFAFTEWSKKYGDIVYLRMAHIDIIVINSVSVANELLEKRSGIYSSRMSPPILKLIGWEWLTPLLPYGDDWRAQRRILHQHFNAETSKSYERVQTKKIHELLANMLAAPDDFMSHLRHSAGAIIMSVVYDYDASPRNDPFVESAEAAITNLTQAVGLGRYLVNVLPILRFVPEWFPGAAWKRFCGETVVLTNKMISGPIERVKQRLRTGEGQPCIAGDLLSNLETEEELRHALAVCGSAYTGGADTTVATTTAFVYAMVNFQDAQAKAQEEIDRVVGTDRLPSFEDRDSLPYVEAICREVLRWRPTLPIGIPHRTTEEDVYRNCYIPKGTVVIPNVWAMGRESHYKDPELFNPSRFFNENSQLNDDDVGYAFGFGRRICPGRHLAFSTVWLTVATMLTAFDIRYKKDSFGQDIPVDSGFGGEMAMHALPFKCSITPRSEGSKKLIKDATLMWD